MHHRHETAGAEQLAIGLGWFSIGLGVAEITAPGSVARLIGVPLTSRTTALLRMYGIREVGTGLAILAQPREATWLWSRVAGDAIDVATLGAGLQSDRADGRRIAAATGAVLGVTALDVLCATRLQRERAGVSRTPRYHVHVERVTTVNRPIEQVYAFWKDFERFPRFMRHLESVQVTAPGRSRWRAHGPAGVPVEWEAEIVEDRENELIAWRSLEGAAVENRGTVRFQRAPGARGTEVRVQLIYTPPGGAAGQTLAWLFGRDPEQQIHEDLHRFKQLVETGEVPLSEGPGLWRPARPAADPDQIRKLAGVQR